MATGIVGEKAEQSVGVTPLPEAEPPHPKRPPRKVVLGVLGAAIVAALVWWIWFSGPAVPPNVIEVSGRIEGDDSAVAAKTSGRIREILVREGDVVKAGATLAVLDEQQAEDRVAQCESALEQSKAQEQMALSQIDVLQQQLHASELGVGQSSNDAEGRVAQAEAQQAAAESALVQAEANLKMAEFNRDAYARLLAKDAVSRQQALLYQTNADTQAGVVAAAKKQAEAARAAVVTAKANLTNPEIRKAQTASIQYQIAQQRAQVAAARAGVARANAQLSEVASNRRDLHVIAPFDGTVATRTAEPGEVIAAGTPILTMVDLNQIYLRGFVPGGQIGRVRLGQPARVYLDSSPNQPLDAVVSRVDPQASFTPENTYFRDDRVKQVVGIKLQLRNPEGFAKPGMPADGEILVEGSHWPGTKRHR
jgi:HlyD family secretion protein